MENLIKIINDWHIETPDGYVDFSGIGKVIEPVSILKITLEDNTFIEVNLSHIFIVNDMEIIASDLDEGDILETIDGFKEIVNIELLEKDDIVYTPLEVKSKGHIYYANGIKNINCKFLGSSSTLIDSDIIERIDVRDPTSIKWTGLFNIYESPIQNHQYILGVDCGKGVGRDASVIQVLDLISEIEVRQVAVYRNQEMSPHDFAQICISISDYYNKSMMMIENNDIGEALCTTIWYEYDCDRIVNIDPKGLGIRSTRKTKLEANLLLKEYMEKEYLEIYDRQTVYELSRYEEITPNVFACGNTDHDDCVTSLLWALFYIKSDYYDGKQGDIKNIDKKYRLDKNVDDELPFIYIDY